MFQNLILGKNKTNRIFSTKTILGTVKKVLEKIFIWQLKFRVKT